MQSFFDSSQYELFFLNIEIAAALWVHIAVFESTLRTFLIEKLSIVYEKSDWWTIADLLSQKDFKDVRKVIGRLKSRNLDVTPTLIFENLSFSFWVEYCSEFTEICVVADEIAAQNRAVVCDGVS